MQPTALQNYAPETEPTESQGTETPEAEKAVVRMVNGMYLEAKKAKEPYDKNWLSYYKFFRGNQWPEKRPSYRHSEVLNFIFSEVQTVLVMLTDNRPNIETIPEDPTDLEFSQILSQILKSKWDGNNWSAVVAESILDASIYGTAIGAVPWKPELLSGLGDFVFQTVDPFHFFPDSNVRSKVNDEYCDWVITAIPTDVKKLKAKYHHKADLIKPDLGDLSSAYQDKAYQDEIRYKSPTDNRVLIEGEKQVRSTKENQVLEICCYMKSDEMEEEEIKGQPDPDTGLPGESTFQTKKKYPNGRKIVIANGQLLEDGPNPYAEGRFPFARLVDHAMPREFWGIGEVENLKSPQMIVNKLISYILDVLTIMGNPIWIVDNNSGINTDNLTNQPGLAVEKNPGSEVRRETGVGLQPYVMETLQYMAERVLTKLGSVGDVSKGVAPADSSGYAIAQLKESDQTKIRGKSRNLEYFLKDIGALMVDRILEHYTVPRIVRVTNSENAAQYFKFHVTANEDETGEIQKTVTVSQMMQDPLTGEWAEAPPKDYPVKSRLDVRFSVGSSLPFAKLENRTLAEKLFDKGVIDAEEYLTQLEYPNKEKIIERLKQAQAAQAQSAQMQGAMNGNANGPAAAAPAA